jgi:hypothetical protein
LPSDKAVQLQAQRFGVQPVGLYPAVLLIELLWTDDVTVDPKPAKPPLQRKTKAARFVDGMDHRAGADQFCRPVQEGAFAKALRRSGISAVLLFDHDVKLLVHINPKLMTQVLPLNWQRVPSSEDNSVFVMTLFISAGESNNSPAPFTCHLSAGANSERVREQALNRVHNFHMTTSTFHSDARRGLFSGGSAQAR